MRKNCEETVRAFMAGRKRKPAESIWTDGETIYSYRTALVQRHRGGVILNRTKYSQTTTIHQNALAAYFHRNGVRVTEVDGAPFGVGPCALPLFMETK